MSEKVKATVPMSYYDQNFNIDVVSPVSELLDNKEFYIDGKTLLITPTLCGRTHYDPWVTIKLSDRNDCYFWKDILWKYYRKYLGEQPPVGCQKCWKVIVRPRNVVQLKDLELTFESIKDKIRGCKCGVEIRPEVRFAAGKTLTGEFYPSWYGGYIYNYSKPEGLRILKLIREILLDQYGPEEAPDSFLKRGCTEYEKVYGNPDNWHINQNQEEVEAFIKSKYDWEKPVDNSGDQDDMSKARTRRFWVEFAKDNGDLTYLSLISRPMHFEYKRYEE